MPLDNKSLLSVLCKYLFQFYYVFFINLKYHFYDWPDRDKL